MRYPDYERKEYIVGQCDKMHRKDKSIIGYRWIKQSRKRMQQHIIQYK
jgi:hypothetical protein